MSISVNNFKANWLRNTELKLFTHAQHARHVIFTSFYKYFVIFLDWFPKMMALLKVFIFSVFTADVLCGECVILWTSQSSLAFAVIVNIWKKLPTWWYLSFSFSKTKAFKKQSLLKYAQALANIWVCSTVFLTQRFRSFFFFLLVRFSRLSESLYWINISMQMLS